MRDPSRPTPQLRREGFPLIGRRNEFQQLIDAIETTRSGSVARLVIIGPAGIGKSRLLLEAARYAEWRGVSITREGTTMADSTAHAPTWQPSTLRLFDPEEEKILTTDEPTERSRIDGRDSQAARLEQSVMAATRSPTSQIALAFRPSERLVLHGLNFEESTDFLKMVCQTMQGSAPTEKWIRHAVQAAAGNPASLEAAAQRWARTTLRVAMPRTT